MTFTVTNRITEALGVEHPIIQAPMGWIARSQLASAVSNAGGMGIIETSSGELEMLRSEAKWTSRSWLPAECSTARRWRRPSL